MPQPLVFENPMVLFDQLLRGMPQHRIPIEEDNDGTNVYRYFEIPGVESPNDINVRVEGQFLTVSGRRKRMTKRDDTEEPQYMAFESNVTLPMQVSADQVSATYESGILTVTVQNAFESNNTEDVAVEFADSTAQVKNTAS